jgi:hypothetical protein
VLPAKEGTTMRHWSVRYGAMLLAAATAAIAEAAEPGGMEAGTRAASPIPAVTPVARQRDPETGAEEIGIGRATGAVKSSGDEGGTAAGMPGKGPGGQP